MFISIIFNSYIKDLFPQAIHLFPKEGAAAQALDTSKSTYQSASLGLRNHVHSWPDIPNATETVITYWVRNDVDS